MRLTNEGLITNTLNQNEVISSIFRNIRNYSSGVTRNHISNAYNQITQVSQYVNVNDHEKMRIEKIITDIYRDLHNTQNPQNNNNRVFIEAQNSKIEYLKEERNNLLTSNGTLKDLKYSLLRSIRVLESKLKENSNYDFLNVNRLYRI